MAVIGSGVNFPQTQDFCSLHGIKNQVCCNDDFHSILAIVIECRKLEIKQTRKGQFCEHLIIYVADKTCQLFPVTIYGQEAMHYATTSTGDIIVIEDLVFRKWVADDGHINTNGSTCERTKTSRVFNSQTVCCCFPEQQSPSLHQQVTELHEWAREKYPFFYTR